MELEEDGMFTTHRIIQKVLTFVVLLSLTISGSSPYIASAQGNDGVNRNINSASGKLSFIGPANGSVLAASEALGSSSLGPPIDPAMALAKRFGPEFGLKNPEGDLTEMRAHRPGNGLVTIRYQQSYQGIPVIGGELIINTNENGDLYSMNGEVSPDLSLSTQPTIDSEKALQSALQGVAKWYQKTPADFVTSEPELWIFDESLLRKSNRPAELVWRMEVTSADNSILVRELVLINAHRGGISLHFNQIDTAWSSHSSDSSANHVLYSNKPGADMSMLENSRLLTFSPLINTYTANGTSVLPGTFLCNQNQPNCTNGSNPHADAAHKYALGTFNLYDIKHNRNSINNGGMLIKSSVHYCEPSQPCPLANASWTGAQMVYGDDGGWPLADDIVAHELTHGVTQYESGLFYYYQSGAINESFSDVWGEYYDQTNLQGNDAVGVKWQIGEDVSGIGAFRSMSSPSTFGHPDKMSSANYYEGADDSGGVHTNSGINNKAAYLMVNGGTFNSRTVSALGWDKTAAIYYEAQTNLLFSGADYSDLYFALQQACTKLTGQKGITSADCIEVKDAIDAVEMNSQPAPNFNTDAPYCDQGTPKTTILSDNLEAGTGKWTFNNGAVIRWQYDSPDGSYAHSGIHSLYAADFPPAVTDATARLTPFLVPGNAYLHFAHAYDFEAILPPPGPFYYDGGVLEYSINGGSTWVDAGSLINFNGYDAAIVNGLGNPLGGRSAFVGSSHGYISTRLNLASLAGKTVTFRWRMGLDNIMDAGGWWLDDIKAYTCPAPANVSVLVAGTTVASYSVPPQSSLRQSYAGLNNGLVKVVSTNGVPIVTSQRVAYLSGGNWTSFSELMGLPASQLSSSYTFPWYNNLDLNSQLRFGNAGTANTTVTVTIGGIVKGSYPLAPNQSQRISYAGLDSGPVKVTSSGNVPIIASLRVAYFNGSAWTSFSELMGLPSGQLTTTYLFPFYNNADLNSQLRFGNVGSANTTVTVIVGGVVRGNYPLAPNQSKRVSYAGLNSGPVRIQSTGGVPIIASVRVAYNNGSAWTNYSEMMGLPLPALSTNYSFPIYDNVNHDSQLRFGNVGTSNTTVTVTIGGVIRGNYNLAPNASQRVSYAGLDSGPVVIQSSGNVPIIASERVAYFNGSVWTSFAEMMGLPKAQLTTSYVFPWYNNVDINTQLRFGVP